MDYHKDGYVRVAFHSFDGQSESLEQLTAAQRWCWVSILAFSRFLRPHGWLNDGGTERKPKGASIRRLARYARVGVRTMHETLRRCRELEMLALDHRRDPLCYEILNWQKWQGDDDRRYGTEQ